MTKLEKVTGRDWPQIHELIKEFNTVVRGSSPDRKRLSEIAAKAFVMELKYVPALNKKITQRLPMQNLCLVTSVGMRSQPILLSIAILKPKSVVFVYTRESKELEDEIKKSPTWKELFAGRQPFTKAVQIDPVDTTGTYEQLANVVKKGKNNNWVIDITGGRKVMGATLSAFGFWRRIPVVYLNSREVQGITEPFSEQLTCIDNPYNTYGDPLLEAAGNAFNNHHFRAAIDALEQLRKTVSLVGLDHMASVASHLIDCYMLWDRFEHSNDNQASASKFYEKFQLAAEQYGRFKYSFFDPKTFDANCKFIKQLRSTYKPSKASLIDEYRMADLYCNSCRRSQQNLFDDAVARLYRCTEMAATFVLKRIIPAFDPDSVDWDCLRRKFVRINLDEIFVKKSGNMAHKSKGLPHIKKIGLAQQIVLMATIAEALQKKPDKLSQRLEATVKDARSIYNIYSKAVNEQNLFAMRNRSILAHGTKPLAEKLYQDFNKVTVRICKYAVGQQKWKELISQASFPRIKFAL